MTRRTVTLSGLVALLVLTLLGTGAPGFAGSYAHRDSTQDVVRVPRDGSECSDCQGTDRPDADIVRFRADYSSQVRLTMSLGDVPERGNVVWLVRYAQKKWLTLGIARSGKRWRCLMVLSSDRGHSVRCAADIKWRVDRHRAVFHATVPAHHVDQVQSIRVGAGSLSYTGTDVFLDDAMRTTYNPNRHHIAFVAGPSIPRG
jgi:hypothetical protein